MYLKNKNKQSPELIKKEALVQVVNILDKNKVDYWLDCGTLLGARRNGKFLEWESDIDFGILPKYTKKMESIRKDLSNNGFKVFYSDWREHFHIVRKGIRIDFGDFRIKDDQLYHFIPKVGKIGNILDYLLWMFSISQAEEKASKMPIFVTNFLIKLVSIMPNFIKNIIFKNLSVLYKKLVKKIIIRFPITYFTKLKIIKFYGINVKIPVKTDEYLEQRYGNNWKIPQRNWKYKNKD